MSFRCPTLDEIRRALFALLPRGRAWQTHEIGPAAVVEQAFSTAFNPDAFQVIGKKGSILWRFWTAFAAELKFLHDRLCALRLEFWCASISETRDEWMTEYGLPDPCDPFPDLCAKVAALGGTRCEYFASIAARAGWSIECIDLSLSCGTRVGCGRAGRARVGRWIGIELLIIVHLNESPSFTGRRSTPPRAGRIRTGQPLACPPNLNALQCLIDRIAPAHVRVKYQSI